jgi:hypothetical protein
MIISDLNHVEVVSEETETSIEGGFPYGFFSFWSSYAPPAPFPGAKDWSRQPPPPPFAGANDPIIYISTFASTSTGPGSGGSFSGSSTVTFYSR